MSYSEVKPAPLFEGSGGGGGRGAGRGATRGAPQPALGDGGKGEEPMAEA